jgi:hypothetical protein
MRESPALNADGTTSWGLPLRSTTSQRRLHSPGDHALLDPIWAAAARWRPKARALHTPRPAQGTVPLPQGCKAYPMRLPPAEEDRQRAAPAYHVNSCVSGWWRVSEGPGPRHPNDSCSIFCWALVVSENKPPFQGATDSEEADGSTGTPTAPSDVWKNSVVRSLLALETFISSSRRQGYQRSTALGLTLAPPWHVSSEPISRPKLKQPWPTFGSPRP